jgi:hypothetical protein
MFYIVLLAIVVGGYLLIKWAMRKAEQQGRELAERQRQGRSGGN